MNGRPSLLDQVRGLLERTYRMTSGLDDLGAFVIGDRGYRRLYPGDEQVQRVGSLSGARLLVRETAQGLRAAVYFPDDLIERLERHPPGHGLGDENVEAFATLVEELDHLLFLAERSREGRPVTLFEMELHANVSKDLVLSRFLAGAGGRLDPARRSWLRHRLFHGLSFTDPDPEVRARYEDAARWAVRYLAALAGCSAGGRLSSLRRFHVADSSGKVDLIRRHAA